MDPILFLAMGAVTGLVIGLVGATLVAERRHRSHELAMQAELQSARQRAERAASEVHAVRTQLVTAEIIAGRSAELEQALHAARTQVEWSAAHVQALEGELAALRTGRRSRVITERETVAVTSVAGAVPAGVSARGAGPARRSRPADEVAVGARPSFVTTPPAPPTAAVADAIPDPPWMAEAAATAAAADAAVPTPAVRRSTTNGRGAPVLGEVIAGTVTDHRARATRARPASDAADRPSGSGVAASERSADVADAGFPEAPRPTAARPRTRATAAPVTGSVEGAARPAADAAADATRPTPPSGAEPGVAPPLPEVAPREPITPAAPPKPPKPHPHGWVPVRPGLADPWTWLGRMSPAGIPYVQDDLQVIHGVGPYLARRLREEGILTWRQVAEWNEEDMALVSRRIGSFPDRIRREDWSTAARALHEARYREKLP